MQWWTWTHKASSCLATNQQGTHDEAWHHWADTPSASSCVASGFTHCSIFFLLGLFLRSPIRLVPGAASAYFTLLIYQATCFSLHTRRRNTPIGFSISGWIVVILNGTSVSRRHCWGSSVSIRMFFVYNGVFSLLVLYSAPPVVVFLPKLLMNCIVYFTSRWHDILQALLFGRYVWSFLIKLSSKYVWFMAF